jgi:MFS family permease
VTKTTGNRARTIKKRPAQLFSRLLVDITPLRESAAFRRLLIGGALSGIGGQMTNYAVLLQVYELTRNSLNVGIVALASGLPMIVAALLSGPLADAIDRRKTVLITSVIQTAVSATLAAQAFTGLDRVWLLYLLVGVQGMVAGLASPASRTFMPSLVRREQLSAGAALQTLVMHGSVLVGPALAGVITAAVGLKVCYLLDAISFTFSLYAVARLPRMRAAGHEVRPGLRSLGEGLRFILSRRMILGVLLADTSATLLGMPIALFPAINAERFGGHPQTLGLMISAVSAGGLLGSALSGPASRVRRQGLGMLVAGVAWGAGLAAFGWSGTFWLAFLSLAFAGAADVTAVVLRISLVQGLTPDNLRGRISAVEFAVGGGAPALGNFRAGAVASLTSPTISAVSGGLAVVAGAALIGLFIPALLTYRSDTAPVPVLAGDDLPGADVNELAVVLAVPAAGQPPGRGKQARGDHRLDGVARHERREPLADRGGRAEVSVQREPGEAGRVDDHLPGQHRRQRPEHRAVGPALGEHAAQRRRQEEPDDVAERRAGPPARVPGEPGDTGDPGERVQGHRGRAAARAECRSGQQHPECLAGDRHRGERQVDGDLGESADEARGAHDEQNVSHQRAGEQVGEYDGPSQGG